MRGRIESTRCTRRCICSAIIRLVGWGFEECDKTLGRVFILGAGASRFAGYPLSIELWRFVRDFPIFEAMAKQRATSVIAGVEQILQVVPPKEFDQPNLEVLFTLLDLAAMGTEPLTLTNVNWRDLRPKLMGMISEAFLGHEYDFQDLLKRNAGASAAAILHAWTNYLREGDTIISFNWDVLHESALWRTGKWHYADGYGFQCEDAPEECRSRIRVLKLHGSVNWAQRNEFDCQPSIEHKATFFPGALDDHEIYLKAAGQWNEGRFLIIPSYLKDVASNPLLLRIWNQASDALCTANEVIVIGYHLHPADAPARQFLGTSLLRNHQLVTILLVSPNLGFDHWDEFCLRIGKTRKLVRKTFEEWITKGPT
jgi:hypothetical protein